MKLLTVVLCVLVVLSFVFSFVALLIVTQNNGVFTPNSPTMEPTTPTYTAPPIMSTPSPTLTPPETDLTITYTEINRVKNDVRTDVTLTIEITFNSGKPINIDYSQFYLSLYAERIIISVHAGTSSPKNSGSFTLSSSHKTQTFQLDFSFGTNSFNGMDTVLTSYMLSYDGPATVQWTNQYERY